MLKGKYFWGALVIIAMWAAVLVIGVVGEGEFVVRAPRGDVHIPTVWGVALFALIGSVVVGNVAFRDRPVPAVQEPPPPSGG